MTGGRTGVIEDIEVELAVVLGRRVPRPMICLNSVMVPMTLMKTMFLTIGASTPVLSIWDVVRMTGVSVSSS